MDIRVLGALTGLAKGGLQGLMTLKQNELNKQEKLKQDAEDQEKFLRMLSPYLPPDPIKRMQFKAALEEKYGEVPENVWQLYEGSIMSTQYSEPEQPLDMINLDKYLGMEPGEGDYKVTPEGTKLYDPNIFSKEEKRKTVARLKVSEDQRKSLMKAYELEKPVATNVEFWRANKAWNEATPQGKNALEQKYPGMVFVETKPKAQINKAGVQERRATNKSQKDALKYSVALLQAELKAIDPIVGDTAQIQALNDKIKKAIKFYRKLAQDDTTVYDQAMWDEITKGLGDIDELEVPEELGDKTVDELLKELSGK